MINWTIMPEADTKKAWDRFYKEFSFYPSAAKELWPSVKTKKPFLKFSIEKFFGETYDQKKTSDFLEKAIHLFTAITIPGEEILVLDWQHECFYADPRKMTAEMMMDDEGSIPIPSFIPNGDYYIFITKDFENTWFGHPWEQTVTLIGEKLVSETWKTEFEV